MKILGALPISPGYAGFASPVFLDSESENYYIQSSVEGDTERVEDQGNAATFTKLVNDAGLPLTSDLFFDPRAYDEGVVFALQIPGQKCIVTSKRYFTDVARDVSEYLSDFPFALRQFARFSQIPELIDNSNRSVERHFQKASASSDRPWRLDEARFLDEGVSVYEGDFEAFSLTTTQSIRNGALILHNTAKEAEDAQYGSINIKELASHFEYESIDEIEQTFSDQSMAFFDERGIGLAFATQFFNSSACPGSWLQRGRTGATLYGSIESAMHHEKCKFDLASKISTIGDATPTPMVRHQAIHSKITGKFADLRGHGNHFKRLPAGSKYRVMQAMRNAGLDGMIVQIDADIVVEIFSAAPISSVLQCSVFDLALEKESLGAWRQIYADTAVDVVEDYDQYD